MQVASAAQLQILQEQVEDKNLKEALDSIAADVEGKHPFGSDGKFPKIFNRLYVNMVKAGEIGGALEQVLDRLALFGKKPGGAIKVKVPCGIRRSL